MMPTIDSVPDPKPHTAHVLTTASISYIVVILDTSIVNVALDSIAGALGSGVVGLQWVVNAYTLAFASLLLSGGALGDRLGARNVYLAGLFVFKFASALCGFAPNFAVLTMARVLQGIGAAMLVPSSLTLLNRAYPDPRERASAVGIWAACGGAALAAGPLVGGLLIDSFGWRSIFMLNIPIGVVGLGLALHIQHNRGETSARHLDLPGQITAMIVLGTLIGILIEGPTLGWHSPIVLAGSSICVTASLGFLTIEARQAQPMLPLSLFKSAIFSGSVVVSMTTMSILFGFIFVFSLYFQQVRGYSPLQTGLALLPLTAVVTASNILSGRWTRTHGGRWPVLVGLGCLILGLGGLVPATPQSPYWRIGLPMLALGMGGGLITPAATASLLGAVEKDRAGIASGALNSARQTGSALGVAIFGAMISTIHPFETGMQIALLVATAISLATAIIWWKSSNVGRFEESA